MEKKMENQMETREYIGVILRQYSNNGKENGNYYTGYVGVIFGFRVLLGFKL